MESLQGRIPLGSAASQAAHPLDRLGVRRSAGTSLTSYQMVSDWHGHDSSVTGPPSPSESTASVLGRRVQPPPDRRGDVRRLARVRPREMVQAVEHPLQRDERPVTVRAVVDVALEAAPAPGGEIAINEIGEMVRGPAVVAAKACASNGVDHHLGNGRPPL